MFSASTQCSIYFPVVNTEFDRVAKAKLNRGSSGLGTLINLYSMRSRNVPRNYKTNTITAIAARITPPLHHSTIEILIIAIPLYFRIEAFGNFPNLPDSYSLKCFTDKSYAIVST
jgi:hypothetical protein